MTPMRRSIAADRKDRVCHGASEERDGVPVLAVAAPSSPSSNADGTQLHPFLRQRIAPVGALACIFGLLILNEVATFLIAGTSSTNKVLEKALKLSPVQTQVVHRHGDRTPITPLEDELFWSTLLPSDDLLHAIGSFTNIMRQRDAKPHPAGGGAVYGRLTSDGLRQMQLVGIKLKSDVERLFSHGGGLKRLENVDPSTWLRVASTDFSRTIQSVQAVLMGLLDSGKDVIDIDARHTPKMIPDPQPRLYVGQSELERKLTSSRSFAVREKSMKPLAIRMTNALFASGVLGEAALKVSFGVGEDETATESPKDLGLANGKPERILPWNQLAEILKCLERRDRLPKGITSQDLEDVAEHNAWRWFSLLSNERLASMAIKSLAKKMIANGVEAVNGSGFSTTPPLFHIFSGHDATLIALMCFFRIERPAVWPEYGSYLKMELLRDDVGILHKLRRSRYYVLFSLNGEPLRSKFGKHGSLRSSRYFVPWLDLVHGLEVIERGLPPLYAA